jgi:DNA repair exonuclease SbcCD ATPase subunit
MCSRNLKTPKKKELWKTQKQLNELRESFNKHQSETKDTIKREIYEIKKTTQNIKKELNKNMEKLRRKNQTEILEIKKIPLVKQKKHHGRSLQQTRTSGRQTLRAQR